MASKHSSAALQTDLSSSDVKNISKPSSEDQSSKKEGKFQLGNVITIGLAHAAHDTYFAFLAPLLPILIERFELTKLLAGTLTIFAQLPSLIQPLVGYIADRINLRKVVILGPALAGILLSMIGILPSYFLIACFLVMGGLISTGVHSVGPVMAGTISGNKLGLGMSIWMMGGELGRTLGPLIIVATVENVGLEKSPWLMLGGFAASIALYIQLKDVKTFYPPKPESLNWRPAVKALKRFMLPMFGFVFLRAFGFAAVTTFLPIYLTERGSTLLVAGASLTLLEAAGILGAMVGGSLSDRYNRKAILMLSLIFSAITLFLFINLTGWMTYPLLMLMGFTTLSTMPIIMAFVMENFPDNKALATGTYMASSFLLKSLAVILTGSFADRFGLQSAYLISSGLTILAIPFIFLIPVSKKETV
ncbi:MAG: MFS transporter [Anaerolineaceae bacterium]|nr:MFS transporter [Anaerolineaceae bacterium]